MSLSSALNSAKSSLAASQAQTALVARNIANVNTAGATRKYAETVTGAGGGVEIRNVAQSGNSVLYRNMLDTTSGVRTSSAVLEGLKRLDEVIGDTSAAGSPAALLGKLDSALRAYAVSPANDQFARAAVGAAGDVAAKLGSLAGTVDTIRRDADSQLVGAAADMNALLADIAKLNDTIVSGTRGRVDVTDEVDQRDRLVAKLATYVGINAQVRGDNDLVLHTDSGVTLFDRIPRPVSYEGTSPLQPGQPGKGFRIDGTLVTGEGAVMPVRDGLVAGLVTLRDETMPAFASQLDAMAAALITSFGETASGGADPRAGLFTSAVPVSGRSASIGAGAFVPGAIADGDTLSFRFTVNGTTYAATATFGTAPADAAAFRAALQSAIDAAVPPGGTTALGAGIVTVGGSGDAVTLRTEKTDVFGLALSAPTLAPAAPPAYAPARTGGLAAAGAPGSVQPGLAAQLRVNPLAADRPQLLRDGGFAGAAYDANPTDAAGFAARLDALADALGASRSFDATGTLATGTLAAFAASSASWLQASRLEASDATTYRQTLLDKTQETLSDATGINMDTELTLLLDLQRSFQASSKILTTVDQMLAALLQAV